MPIGAIIPAAIGAVGSIISGLTGKSAATKAATIQATGGQKAADYAGTMAAQAQTGMGNAAMQAPLYVNESARNANNTLGNVFGSQAANLNPYLAAGTQGVNSFAEAMAPGGSLTQQFQAPTAESVAQTPGYQFAQDQAMKAIQRSASATGTLGSGGTIKAMMGRSSDLANQYYNDAYSRAMGTFQTNRNNTFQGLTALTGIGQTGTAQYNQAAGNYGSQAAQNTMNAGMFQGNTTMNAAQQAGNFGMEGAQMAIPAMTGASNAQAAGVMGSQNATNSMIGGITNAAQYAGMMNMLGGYGQGSGGTASPSVNTLWNLPNTNSYAQNPIYLPGYGQALPSAYGG